LSNCIKFTSEILKYKSTYFAEYTVSFLLVNFAFHHIYRICSKAFHCWGKLFKCPSSS